MKKQLFIFLFAILSVGVATAQCPMCKTALMSNRDGKTTTKPTVGNGINKAILFLMSMPYVLIGGAGAAYYYKKKKAK